VARQRRGNRQHDINRQQFALLDSKVQGEPGQNKVGTREHKNAEDDVKVEGDSRRIPLPDGIEDPVGVRDDKGGAEENSSP